MAAQRFRLTGFTDEAASALEGQIDVCLTLDWKWIDLRTVGEHNIVDLPDSSFDTVLEALNRSEIRVSSFGSRIANWSRTLQDPLEDDIEELRRAIPRMKRAGTPYIRVMSYRPPEGDGADTPEVRNEVIRRLTVLTRIAEEAEITLLHENCETWGGLSVDHTLRLLEAIPSAAFQLAFDTGNPPASVDKRYATPLRCQDALEFYQAVHERVAYIHIKDARADAACKQVTYTWPGEGNGRIPEILDALNHDGFSGPISIEPHMAVVYHDPTVSADEEVRRKLFLEYAERTETLLRRAGIFDVK